MIVINGCIEPDPDSAEGKALARIQSGELTDLVELPPSEITLEQFRERIHQRKLKRQQSMELAEMFVDCFKAAIRADLEQQSAEAKAIARLGDTDEIHWVTDIYADDYIDEAELDAWLASRQQPNWQVRSPILRLVNLLSLADDSGWDGPGYSVAFIKRACQFYKEIEAHCASIAHAKTNCQPFVGPVYDGSISFEWIEPTRELWLTLYEDPAQPLAYYKYNEVGGESEGTVLITAVSQLLDWFFQVDIPYP